MSNAFEKSNAMTTTYGLDRSRSVTVYKSVMIAASVEPMGQNANWSENVNDDGGLITIESAQLSAFLLVFISLAAYYFLIFFISSSTGLCLIRPRIKVSCSNS